jgi:hypothetical protein
MWQAPWRAEACLLLIESAETVWGCLEPHKQAMVA